MKTDFSLFNKRMYSQLQKQWKEPVNGERESVLKILGFTFSSVGKRIFIRMGSVSQKPWSTGLSCGYLGWSVFLTFNRKMCGFFGNGTREEFSQYWSESIQNHRNKSVQKSACIGRQ